MTKQKIYLTGIPLLLQIVPKVKRERYIFLRELALAPNSNPVFFTEKKLLFTPASFVSRCFLHTSCFLTQVCFFLNPTLTLHQ